MWQEENANQDISMIVSEQSHVAIKYQVFAYNEEIKDGRMIILPWKIGKLLVWKTKQSRKGEIAFFNKKKNKTPFINPMFFIIYST